MNRVIASFKTYLTTGLLVLFPLFACAYVLVVGTRWLASFLKPLMVQLLPQSTLISSAFGDIAALVILVCFCVVVGMITTTELGGRVTDRAIQPLTEIPGYRIFVRIARIFFDPDDSSGTPVVVDRGAYRKFGLMMEELEGGEMVVFFPDAPGVISGSVEIVKSSAVHKLDVATVRVFRVIASYGAGTKILLRDQTLWNDKQ